MINIQDKSTMPNLAGIFYPNVFQVTKLIAEMSPLFPTSPNFQSLRHKNLELGGWNVPIASNEHKTLYTLFDGKILNAQKIRTELKKLGFCFTSECDQEVIIHAYDAWGEECLTRFNGPFAMAIWDTKREQLLLARDRIGQKTLYWSDQGDHWLFSTQMKGLLATGLVAQNPSLTAFASFLHFGFVPQELSLIHNVHKLLPGHTIKINLKREFSIGQHYSLSNAYDQNHPMSKEQAVEQLGEKMQHAISQVLIPNATVGSVLSPNLGSTSINWFLAHQGKRDTIHSYDAAFDSSSLSEAKLLADKLNLKHKSEQISLSKATSALAEIIWRLDEPVADPYVMRTWAIAQLGEQLSPYAISALGWKETLAGHSRYFSYGEQLGARPPFAHTLANLPKWIRDDYLLPLLRLLHIPYRFNILRNVDINRKLVSFLIESGLFKENARKSASPSLKHYFNLEVFSQRFHRLTNLPGTQIASLYFDIKTSLPDLQLHQYDRLFSSNNVQMLSPFLDNDLINFLTSVPQKHLLEGNLLQSLLQKLSPNLPHNISNRPRSYTLWGRSKQLRLIFSSLENGRLVEEGLISRKWLQKQVNYPNLTDLAFKQLWSILTLEVWFRLFINRPIGMQPHDISVEQLLGVSAKI